MKKFASLILMSVFAVLALHAQEKDLTVAGVVTDMDGVPLPGVSIVEVGTVNGTQTDFDGSYSIEVAVGSELRFSYLGMKTETRTVQSSNVLNIKMQEDLNQLSEVIVTALGIEKSKKALGYSAQEIDGDAFSEARETNIASSLAGKVAGVQVSNIATGAGGSSRVVIRGNSSISGNDAPLYVVDGIPIDNQNIDPADYAAGGVDYGDGISGINPDDVESMTVLKGPNAAALYGARAANGVILITTKTGGSKKKGIGVTFNSNLTSETIATMPTYQNRFGIGYDPSFGASGTTIIDGKEYEVLDPNQWQSWGPELNGQIVADWEDPTKTFAMVPQPSDNIRNFFQSGFTATNTVSFSSGDEKANMRLSLSNLGNEGIIPGSTYDRQTINFRGFANVTDRFSIDAKVNYIHHKGVNRPGLAASSSNVMSVLIQMPRHIDLDRLKDYKDENGDPFNFTTAFENPYWTINELQNEDERDRVIGFVSMNYKFNDWLNVRARTGTDFYTDERFSRRAIGSRSARTGRVSNYTWHVKENNSDILFTAEDDLSENWSGSLSVGASRLYSKTEVTGALGQSLRVPELYHITNAEQITPRYDKVEREMQSVYAAGQLAYKNYLFLDLTARNDWSSVLGINNYSFFYPSVSTSFVFTDALKLNSNVFSFGKLRAGYAEVGNDSNPYLTTLGYVSNTQTVNGQGQAAIQTQIPNPNLKNELTRSYEFGTDMRFFKNRVGIDFTYYNSSTKNQILPVNISSGTGFNRMVINAGEIQNEGVELLFNVTPIQLKNSFQWDLTLNYAKNKSKVVSLADGIETHIMSQDRWGTIEARPGEDFGNIVGFYYKRNENGEKLLDEYGRYQRDGNNVKILGNIQPDWIAGITNRFSYKGFTLSTLIDIKMGGELLSGTKYIQAARGTGRFTTKGLRQNEDGVWVGVADGVMENDYYVDDGNGNQVLHLAAGERSDIELDRVNLYGMWTRADIIEEFVLDASYISLREINLGYSFSEKLLAKTPFTSARISLVGRNLLYLQEHMDGIGVTPEAAFSSESGSQGSESYTLPSTRSVGVNLNVAF
ncbi:TonB-linked outer membrane protein, SusC/RagA family [Pseudozobellia thermophila]|uniref:TonB-linked outer membrane protein, SusC/RagA family n=2 Tax=Pseudozobellia thermophila TaxID=192903 RepID=A0A1M6NLX8_9FLAO|nr:TonB-linked outer membrane protein, SusC/RagA family [Pseudozobellia thermophila]